MYGFQKITLHVYSDISVGFRCSVQHGCIEESNINCAISSFKDDQLLALWSDNAFDVQFV